MTPVWFIVEDDCLVFNTGQETAKGRALARDPRTTICADLDGPPYVTAWAVRNAKRTGPPAGERIAFSRGGATVR